jgi:hypothetical protein
MTPPTASTAPSQRNDQSIEGLLQGDPPDFQALAEAFMGMGMAAEAARCHGWDLLTPSDEIWRPVVSAWRQRLGADPGPATAAPTAADQRDAAMTTELETIQGLLDRGEMTAACARITQLSHVSNLSPNLCNRAAMLHAGIGDFWEAERWYRTSLVQQEAQVQPWFGLAAVLLRQGACDEALEAAAVGLSHHPDHPWGLKLRQHALQGLHAPLTLRHLADQGKLPFALGKSELPEAVGFVTPAASDTISLREKLLLQSLLHADPLLIWCVGPSSHGLVPWLAMQRLLPSETRVQVFADPDADHCDLSDLATGIVIEASQPMYRIRQVSTEPNLTILGPSATNACPLITAHLIAMASPLLISNRLDLVLPQHRAALKTEHWQLLLATTAGA